MGRKATRKPEVAIAQSLQQPEGSMRAFVGPFVESLQLKQYAESTIRIRCYRTLGFIEWSEERGVTMAVDVHKAHVERYHRWLHHYRTEHGRPLGRAALLHCLLAVREFFRWLSQNEHIPYSPAADLELPKTPPPQLPKQVLTAEQVEDILALTDVESPLGIRDRAILETLYSTGVRRKELVGLALYDVDPTRGLVHVRHGKGGRQRFVPIGTRALLWVQKYVQEARPMLQPLPEQDSLFLAVPRGAPHARPMTVHHLGLLVRDYLDRAGLSHAGSCCHLFRHAMATLMLENGADVRYLQAMLGHRNLETTETYTHVAIGKLKQVHAATHPADMPEGFAQSCMDVAGTDAATLCGVKLETSADRLPGYPGKARQDKAPHRRPHKTYEWKNRLVRNAGSRPPPPGHRCHPGRHPGARAADGTRPRTASDPPQHCPDKPPGPP